ncbi:uncharacterized protein METZ01_LOCUS398488, partial [marine metagenome]
PSSCMWTDWVRVYQTTGNQSRAQYRLIHLPA